MKRDNSPWRSLETANLHWNETGLPVSASFADVYYSRDNGLKEGRHVFLQGNDLPQRWCTHPRKTFCIAETGFGTGLNFLLTWQAWRETPEPRPALHYLSVEKFPLCQADLERALACWPSLQELAKQLAGAYPGPLPGEHRILLDGGRVRLDLWWEDAGEALTNMASHQQSLVDAWYLDGFAPSRNSAMWTPQLLQSAAILSRPGASFATFTAAGQVRRDLNEAGFQATKVPGYGSKRECLRGERHPAFTPKPTANELSPWDIPAAPAACPETALIVGGGLAGCTTAAALASRGVAVTVLEQDSLAGAGSGNEQGILYTRLSRKHSALLDFSLQSFQFAVNFYHSMFQSGELKTKIDGELCGSFQQSSNAQDMAVITEALAGLEEFAQVLDSAQASVLLGIEQPGAGFWYPGSGWMNPGAICKVLLQRPGIRVIENCGELTLRHEGKQWLALSGEQVITEAECAIAATGTGSTALEQFSWLPLQSIRGQTTLLPTSGNLARLGAVLCHEGYIAPARKGYHCIGATFDIHDNDPTPSISDHQKNLSKLATAVPHWENPLQSIDLDTLNGRVGYRCTSPDYLPTVGPAPDFERFLMDFGPLRKDARQTLTTRGGYLSGLFITTSHGSRGLTSTPLAAELLASMICNEPVPLNRKLCRALSPARFIIRDLIRNRV